MSSAVDLWNVSQLFGADILDDLNLVKNMLKEQLQLIFIHMKFKDTLNRET